MSLSTDAEAVLDLGTEMMGHKFQELWRDIILKVHWKDRVSHRIPILIALWETSNIISSLSSSTVDGWRKYIRPSSGQDLSETLKKISLKYCPRTTQILQYKMQYK